MFETSKIFHRLRRDKAPVVIAALLSFDVAVPPAIASDILIGRAVLPAATFAPGPDVGSAARHRADQRPGRAVRRQAAGARLFGGC